MQHRKQNIFFIQNRALAEPKDKDNMRKTWVKRENIYFKPFYKQKSKMFLLLIFLVGISFIAYQVNSRNVVSLEAVTTRRWVGCADTWVSSWSWPVSGCSGWPVSTSHRMAVRSQLPVMI